ncbi:MAG: lamin tail domain-containing protein, partial [Myxococcota bacterium]
GCALIDASNNSTPIGRIVIQPSGTLLFARSESGNGDIEPDALFDFGLNNDDESVILLCAGTIIDQVVYGSTFPIQPGYALSLDPGHTTADGNDQATNWCPSPDRYYEGNASPIGDHYGTPGRPNPACAPIDPSDPCDPNPCTTPPSPRCEGSTLITPQGPGTCSPMGDDASCLYPENTRDCTNEGRMCSASACIENTTTRAPTPGDLIVSEILYDPEGDLADGGSNNGEWVELYNTTRDTLMLDGCTVDDSNGNGTANLDGLMVPPDGYLVVGRGPGLPSLPDATFTFSLNNDDGDTVIVACGETIDSVSYGSGFPSADAASLNLNPDTLDATANDSGANWCPATEVYYMGNPAHLGTPGASNTPCDG